MKPSYFYITSTVLSVLWLGALVHEYSEIRLLLTNLFIATTLIIGSVDTKEES